VDLFTGACEIGQGSDTTLSMICAEELGVRLEDIRIHAADPVSVLPISAPGEAGDTDDGNAVKMAAADAKRQLLSMPAPRWAPIRLRPGHQRPWVHLVDRPERGFPYLISLKRPKSKDGEVIIGRGTIHHIVRV